RCPIAPIGERCAPAAKLPPYRAPAAPRDPVPRRKPAAFPRESLQAEETSRQVFASSRCRQSRGAAACHHAKAPDLYALPFGCEPPISPACRYCEANTPLVGTPKGRIRPAEKGSSEIALKG